MSLYERILKKVHAALISLYPDHSFDFSRVVVEPAKDPSHGHMATNAAMVLSKNVGMTPQNVGMTPKKLAELIASKLLEDDDFLKVDIAGPGFINLTLKDHLWHKQVKDILSLKKDYGKATLGKDKTVNIEFVSANPTGPLHTGHGRNAVFGDVIAALLKKVGYNVQSEYYINDAGGQIQILCDSVYLRYQEACGLTPSKSDYDGKYPGDYLIPIGKALFDQYGHEFIDKERSFWFEPIRKFSVDAMMKEIKNDLQSLGVSMDIYTSEKELTENGNIEEVLNILQTQGHIYEGVLTPPKGHTIDDWEERPQTLFRSTLFGDDVDRAIKKSDGSWTYFAGDLGYHLDKIRRGYNRLINIFGADHIGYIKRLKAAVSALSNNQVDFDIKATQLVNFLDNGVPVRMSKRAGTFITIQDVIEKVGKDVTRFMMVSRHQDMPIDFDFTKAIEQSKENPIFYIQYAHARIHSVLRHAATEFDLSNLENANLPLLTHVEEKEIMHCISQWPRIIMIAAQNLEPHRLCSFLYDLAAQFHALWNAGKDNATLRFINQEDKEGTLSRLALISAVAIIIQSGLELLGITALEEMR